MEEKKFTPLEDIIVNYFGVDVTPEKLDSILEDLIMFKTMYKCSQEENESDVHFYKSFLEYLCDRVSGPTENIIEAVVNNQTNEFIGYLNVERIKDEIGDLAQVKFKINDSTITADYQHSDNYAVHQWTGYLGDDYSGYLLYPTTDPDVWFCQKYSC